MPIRRRTQNYREARPRVDLVVAIAAAKQGKVVCRFQNQFDDVVGEAFFLDLEHSPLDLAYMIHGIPDVAQIGTSYGDSPNRSRVLREYFQCPLCKKRVAIVAFVQIWACCRCLKLHYRSQVVPPDELRLQRVNAINAKIGRVRPTRMRETTFRALDAERRALKASLGRFPKLASTGHQTVITAKWVTLEQAGELMHPDFHIVEGEIVQEDFLPERDEPAALLPPPGPRTEPKVIRLAPDMFDGLSGEGEFDL